MTSTFRTSHLPQTQDYQRLNDYATLDERIAVSYRRARAIAKAYGNPCSLLVAKHCTYVLTGDIS